LKVLLIRPHAPNALNFVKILDSEPLELEYLHTVLQANGHDDYIYDGLIETKTVQKVILRESPDMICVTGYITQEKLMLKYAQAAKDINPKIVTVLGGVHAQRTFERLYSPYVDYILRSEDINILIDLIRYIEGESVDINTLNGVCYNTCGEFHVNQLKPACINELPIPDRSFFYKNRQKYRYLDLTEVATIKTAFSCPYSCNFCYCTLLNGGRYMARDLNLVIEELKNIDAQNIQIADDDFPADKERVLEFIRLVKENNIHKTYICYSRADFAAENPEIIKSLAEIGFKYFLVGLEAVMDNDLENYNKGTTVEVNRKCVEVINSTSARCIALMIAPIEADKAYFDNMYKWIAENNLKHVTVSIFTPIPGTPLYEEYKDKLISHDIEDWDFLHLVVEPVNLSRQEFYRQYMKLFLRLYNKARKTGIYSFMDIIYYKNLLVNYLKRKVLGH
jgi:radical SAM superfamily enzyme YgiQ (UPF0313 family)